MTVHVWVSVEVRGQLWGSSLLPPLVLRIKLRLEWQVLLSLEASHQPQRKLLKLWAVAT